MRPLRTRWLQPPIISRLRRNHALEHATIHLLSARYPHRTLIGRSDLHGILIYGNLPTPSVDQAAREALNRLRAGEPSLALHPNCGTNLLVAALLAGVSVFLLHRQNREDTWLDRLGRLPSIVSAILLALIISRPLGTAAQRHLTTQADLGPLEILGTRRLMRGYFTAHRVLTGDGHGYT